MALCVPAGIAALADVNAGVILHASGPAQLISQLIALGITLAIAIGGGLVGGLLLKKIPQSLDVEDMYDDEGVSYDLQILKIEWRLFCFLKFQL